MLKPWIQRNVRLSKREDDANKLLRRVSLCAEWKCMGRLCIFTTDDREKMLQHLRNHELAAMELVGIDDNMDTDSWLECAYCEMTCSSDDVLVQHVQEQHGNSIYQCHWCFYRSTTRLNVFLHCQKYHGSVDPSVIHCNKQPVNAGNESNELVQRRQQYLRAIKCPLGGG